MTAKQPSLDSPVTVLRGVGERVAEKLKNIGVETVQDLLFHLPSRYEDRTRVTPMSELRHGERVTVEGEVISTKIIARRRRMLVCELVDDNSGITLRFFHFNRMQMKTLVQGARLRCHGEVREGRYGFEMAHPEYHPVAPGEDTAMEQSLTAVYPTTEGLHQLTIRKLLEQALAFIDQNTVIEELIPAPLYQSDDEMADYNLVQSLQYLHRPPPDAPIEQMQQRAHPCQKRLAFEELLAHNLSLQQARRRMREYQAPVMDGGKHLHTQLRPRLGFDFTAAQVRVIKEIMHDLKQPHPMLRLVQGDVGSGKTVVATAAALKAILSGYQVAFMAPTEILAEQHFRNLDHWLTPLGVELAWLAGKQKGLAREQAMDKVASGEAKLVAGTHALFQQQVAFKNLGLIIVDEQHRFGVHQRLQLMEKGAKAGMRPHQMIMTATPIPRTLAMSAYADLDTSVIDELPPGRQPVTTVVVPEQRRAEIIERVREASKRGRQTYWVCPLIEESDALQAQAATDTHALLQQQLPELKVRLIHGRLKPAEKERIMQTFKAGDIDLLVATTVIEVGVDVPNASLMIIENAERLGLSQLHQLRGRVGRGDEQSACALMYKPPLSDIAKQRLAILRQTNDGFEIAQRDLELRGPGEVLGTRQTGALDLRVADLMRDQEIMTQVAAAAKTVFDQHPEVIEPLLHRWLRRGIQFAEV